MSNPGERARRLASGLVLAAAGVLALGACSSGSSHASTGATTVTVHLREWKFLATPDEARAGEVTFAATNDGTEVHELVLFRTDLAPAELPRDQDGAVDERGAGLELVDEVEDVRPGQTKSFTADLAAGSYVMACNVIENGEVHFAHRMYRRFTVT